MLHQVSPWPMGCLGQVQTLWLLLVLSLSCRVCLDTIPSCITYVKRPYHSRSQWVTLPAFGGGGARKRPRKLWRMKKTWHEIHHEVQKQNCDTVYAESQLKVILFEQCNLRFEAVYFETQMNAFLHPLPLQTTVQAYGIVSDWSMQWISMSNQYLIEYQ